MQKEPIHILLADDDADDRRIFKDALEELKMKTVVHTVNDGVELMEYLAVSEKLPHILFLDLNMPRKNGLACLKEIKLDERLKDISVVIYSTSSSEENIEETFVKGANIYINKPNNFDKLRNVLAEIITINWQYHTSGLNRNNFLLRF